MLVFSVASLSITLRLCILILIPDQFIWGRKLNFDNTALLSLIFSK